MHNKLYYIDDNASISIPNNARATDIVCEYEIFK